jgi:hypothetical protein
MTRARTSRRGQSVPPEEKRQPKEIVVVFPAPVEEEQPDSTAKPTAPAVQSGSPRKPARIVFRF